jgi:hypothetical protein
VMSLGVAAGLALLLSKGWPQRFDPEVGLILAQSQDQPRLPACAAGVDDVGAAHAKCRLGVPGAAPSFALWGDSHAEALVPAIEGAAWEAGASGLIAVRGGCPPLVGVRQVREGFRDCADRAEAFLAELATMPEIKTVVLAARWALYTEGERFRREAGHTVFVTDDVSSTPSLEANAQVVERGLRRTVERLRAMGRTVVFVSQVPETEFHLPRAMARLHHLGRPADESELAPLRAHYEARQARVEQVLRSIAPALPVVRVEQALCAGERCTVARNGLPIYRDSNHLTASHAHTLTPMFVPVLLKSAN